MLFPAIISARTGMLAPHVWMHFIASFTLSGLIALAYSLCGSQFVIQRALYPRMWDDVRHFTAVARQELAPMATRLVLDPAPRRLGIRRRGAGADIRRRSRRSSKASSPA